MKTDFQDCTVQAAARWYARLQAGDCTAADRDAFERWCAADPANPAAYAAARDLAAHLARSAATSPRLQAMAQEALAGVPGRAPAARVRRRFGVAAGLAAGIVAVLFTQRLLHAPAAPTVEQPSPHIESAAHVRSLTLDDGTRVSVDVDTELDVQFTESERHVRLVRGRAVFDVAHDAGRPFVVAAGNERVKAVGTRFQVTRTAAETVVTLAEGVVTVSSAASAARSVERLAPGDELTVARGDGWSTRSVDPRVATSWSFGRLLFRETRLTDALQEVNRYATKKVRLADASLGDLRVSGNFLAGDSRTAVAAFAAVLPLVIVENSDEVALYRVQDAHR